MSKYYPGIKGSQAVQRMLEHIITHGMKAFASTCLLPVTDRGQFLGALQTMQREPAQGMATRALPGALWAGVLRLFPAGSKMDLIKVLQQASASVVKLLTMALNRRNCFIVDSITSLLVFNKLVKLPATAFDFYFNTRASVFPTNMILNL